MPEPQTSAPDTSLGIGLTRAEAAHRLATDGPNELASQGPRGVTRIIREVLTEPMLLLLLAAAAIYVVLGDVREALILTASIVIVIAITTITTTTIVPPFLLFETTPSQQCHLIIETRQGDFI